ncbi:MAG: translation initiation factor IF-3 [Firmicutes bacterium]|nr:translation initiation factor IF-3 [Bacillota bacterium]
MRHRPGTISWRCPTINEVLINEEIRDREVRVIDSDGTQLGIMPTRDALRLAQEKELDLINIAPQATPPVCKILDFGKYRFEQTKREKEAKKKQKVIEIKEVRLSPNIDDHDMETKAKSAAKFLQNGDKVKVSVRFRGRELSRTEIGKKVLDDFVESISDVATVEKPARMEGRSMVMFLMPKR